MIATKQKEVVGVGNFVGEEEHDGLEAVLSAIHVVSQEQVVDTTWEANFVEDTEKI